MKTILLTSVIWLLLGCEPNVSPEEPKFWQRHAFFTIIEGDSVWVSVNIRFINTSGEAYTAFPRLYYGEVFDGGFGYLRKDDWTSTSTNEERFQPLGTVFTAIEPGEMLAGKVLTGKIPLLKDKFRLVFVINGKEYSP